MDQPQSMEVSEPKSNTGPPLRRGPYDEHDPFRQNTLDLKYPFPQSHLFPPSLSIRSEPPKSAGPFLEAPSVHDHSQRYTPQEYVTLAREIDDKRYKGQFHYPSGAGQASMSHLSNALHPPGINLYNGSGAGAGSFRGLIIPPSVNHSMAKPAEEKLVTPIPPLHVQQENSRKEELELTADGENVIQSKCSRCKKEFVQRLVKPAETGKAKTNEPKVYKLCFHCRDLQRQRSRRWQKKTKDKEGACRRCGSEIPLDQQKRTNLERMGNCNRCAKALTPDEQGKHKVCFTCRQKKKKLSSISAFNPDSVNDGQSAPAPPLQSSLLLHGPQHLQPRHHLQNTMHGPQPGQQMPEMAPNVMMPLMSFMPMEQGGMLMHPGMGGYAPPQDHMAYGQMQHMPQGAGEMYKPPQLPHLQPHVDQGYQQYIGYPPVGRNGLHYSNSRM
ncbi:hypothetical protein HF325_006078 [Metschnikowia pulcherrima]|uniref:Uncharacterized protein n=1 Tax=Metschnikowia pulcherrima TaxID=27326 RepID=A0A8H7GLY6_9ASCO|nr:hypothetical protein HF325_006078 [Metschnikowia pulcherrima]